MRILVAMSGGVDSSTAAALLKAEGHEVIGVGLRLPLLGCAGGGRSCCCVQGMDDARRVADRLGFPFYAVNCEEFFTRRVVDYFCSAYLEGLTPNPCVECNRSVKFGYLLKMAEDLGAERLATGHYARVERDPETGRFRLRKGADGERDQSYFLYPVTQGQLGRILFPLGGMTKVETRRAAASFGLHVENKPGSQDVCFLGDTDYRRFLAERFSEAALPGPVLNTRGEEIGRHDGIARFTVGQRKGIGLAAREPLYVLAVLPGRRAVVVGAREDLMRERFMVSRVNWLSGAAPEGVRALSVKLRYREREIPARVAPLGADRAEVVLERPRQAAAPGQSAVFYEGDVVVGGGIIDGAPPWEEEAR